MWDAASWVAATTVSPVVAKPEYDMSGCRVASLKSKKASEH